MLDKSSMHRLIGAGIMLIAAISVLPIILDGERPADLGLSVTPPSPAPNISEANIKAVKKLPIIKNQVASSEGQKIAADPSDKKVAVVKKIEAIPQSEPSADISSSSKVIEAQSSLVVKKEAVRPESKNTGIQRKEAVVSKKVDKVKSKPSRWVVQIASFKNRNNSTQLVKKLQAANYAAYNVTTKTLYKVFVGPEIQKSRADKIKEEIKKQFRLDGFVVKYSEN